MDVFSEVEEWAGHLFHPHHGQPAPSFTPADRPPTAQEGRMSAFTELQHLLAVADEDALRAVNTVLSHPEGVNALSMLAGLAGFAVPPGTITAALGGVSAVLGVIAPQPATVAPVPAVPTGAQPAQPQGL